MKPYNIKLLATLLLAVSCLFAAQARAQSYLSPGYILGEIRDGLGIIQQPTPPEFVIRGRPDPATIEYVPLKPPPRDFHAKENTPAKRIEAETGAIAELEAARANNQVRARAEGGQVSKHVNKTLTPVDEDPPPMKWNAWDTE